MEAKIEAIIDDLEKAQAPDGYLNCWYLGHEPDKRWINLLKEQIQAAELELVAELASADATVEQLLSFKPGDFIELDLKPLVAAKVDGVPLLEAHYGISGGKYALKVDRLIASSSLSWIGDSNGN